MAIRPFVDRSTARQPLRLGGSITGRAVSAPIVTEEADDAIDQVRVAMTVAAGTGGVLHLVDPSERVDPLRVEGADLDREELESHVRTWIAEGAASDITSGRGVARQINEYVEGHDVDTLVLPAELGRGGLGRRRHDRIAAAATCDVVSVNGDGRFEEFASMLVPVGGGPHAGLAVDVAGRIAEGVDAWIDVLHVLPEDATEEDERAASARLEEAIQRTGREATANPWILRADDPAATIVEQSAYYGATVIGAPTSGRLTRFLYGSTSRAIRREADSLVIAARTPDPAE